MKRKLTKVTLKMAKAIVSQETGIKNPKLERDTGAPPDICRFTLEMGSMNITVKNDWYDQTDRVILEVYHGLSGQNICLYFDPESLETDFEATQRYTDSLRKEIREG